MVAEEFGQLAGNEVNPAEPAALVPQRELTRDRGQFEQFGKGILVRLQHCSLCISKDTVPRLLCVVEVRPGQFDGVFEVFMVDVEERKYGAPLAQ